MNYNEDLKRLRGNKTIIEIIRYDAGVRSKGKMKDGLLDVWSGQNDYFCIGGGRLSVLVQTIQLILYPATM